MIANLLARISFFVSLVASLAFGLLATIQWIPIHGWYLQIGDFYTASVSLLVSLCLLIIACATNGRSYRQNLPYLIVLLVLTVSVVPISLFNSDVRPLRSIVVGGRTVDAVQISLLDYSNSVGLITLRESVEVRPGIIKINATPIAQEDLVDDVILTPINGSTFQYQFLQMATPMEVPFPKLHFQPVVVHLND